jgi:hypothetical protein
MTFYLVLRNIVKKPPSPVRPLTATLSPKGARVQSQEGARGPERLALPNGGEGVD